jgi:hypothetical protein
MYLPSACQVRTKLNNDRTDSIEGLMYHHFFVHRILNVLISSSLIEGTIAGVNVGGTVKEPGTRIMVRMFHRYVFNSYQLCKMPSWWLIAMVGQWQGSASGS